MSRVAGGEDSCRGVARVADDIGLAVKIPGPTHQRPHPHELKGGGAIGRNSRGLGIIPRECRANQPTAALMEIRDALGDLGVAARRSADAGARKIRTTAERTRREIEEPDHALEGRSAADRRLYKALLEGRHLDLERSDEQVFLAAKAPIEGAEGDARLGRDVAQSDGLETTLLGQFHGRVDDSLCSLFHRGRY